MPLISAANVRDEITGLSASDDTELGLLIAEADALAAGWMYFPAATSLVAPTLTVATYTDWISGPDIDDNRKINLTVRPMVSITTIHDDPDRAYGADTLVASTEYTVTERHKKLGIVLLDTDSTHAWSTAEEAIRVVYTAGWTDGSAPPDLRRALLEIVGSLWRRRHISGLPSATPIEQDPHVIPLSARQALRGYRLWERAARG